MANWASTSYVIEGPRKTLEWIERAIFESLANNEACGDERDILDRLGIKWEPRNIESHTGHYLRGAILEETTRWEGDILRFDAEEAWGVTDFDDCLKSKFPDIKVFWVTQEEGCEVYQTNDAEGKYFPDRYWVDTCIDAIYKSEYFKTEEAAYKWLSTITSGRVTDEDSASQFNDDYADSGADDENFIYIHKFDIISTPSCK